MSVSLFKHALLGLDTRNELFHLGCFLTNELMIIGNNLGTFMKKKKAKY